MDPAAFVYMALSGEQELGAGAVVVDTAKCHAKYVKLEALEPAHVRKQLGEQMSRDPDTLFILQRTEEHLHVFTYPKQRALQRMKEGSLPALQ